MVLEQQGAKEFFGEPSLEISDLMRTAPDGRGVINILNATELFNQPTLYSTVLLPLLSELYETLPEEDDLDKPKMVFFFDEAHVLFKDAPKVLLEKAIILSDYYDNSFGKAYGVLMKEWNLLARAVLILDEENKVIYTEYVDNVNQHPDYDAAVAALKK